MKLEIKNIGVIADSSLCINGLTVITGENNTGKTTIGKALNALLEGKSCLPLAASDSDYSVITLRGDDGNIVEERKLYGMKEGHPTEEINDGNIYSGEGFAAVMIDEPSAIIPVCDAYAQRVKLPSAICKKLDEVIPCKKATQAIPLDSKGAGFKLFFVLKILLERGRLNENTVLILDDVDAHLHPKWQNQLGELLCLMVKEMNVRVVLTTNSPNMVLALDAYMRKYDIPNQTNFYLAQKDENGKVKFVCEDEDISAVYADFTVPFLEAKVLRDIYLEGRGE